jgi:hypothetical protein
MEGLTIERLGIFAANRYKSFDRNLLENYYNFVYDPVKYHISGFSSLVGCMVNIGTWSIATTAVIGREFEKRETGISFKNIFEKTFINSIEKYCQTSFVSEPANRIYKGAFITGDEELAFIRHYHIQNEVGIIIEMANQVFINKEFQAEIALSVDSESEQWETLLFRFYVNVTTEEFMGYQKELVRRFVSNIEPSKRIYFSIIIEPV